jgi:hypothetical protein
MSHTLRFSYTFNLKKDIKNGFQEEMPEVKIKLDKMLSMYL